MIVGRSHFASEHFDDFALRRRRELAVGRQFFSGEPALLQALKHPLEQIHLRAHLHLAFVRKRPFGVQPVEIHFAVVEPPRLDEIAIERGIEPDRRAAFRRQERVEQTLGGRMPEAGEINHVPAVGKQNAVVTFLRERVLKFFYAGFVPGKREAIVSRRLEIVWWQEQRGGFAGRAGGWCFGGGEE
jgi:hypothetical protein